MFVIALTGGIASGKSTVTEQFARLGVPIIDTDRIARELVEPGQPALAEILTQFGPAVVQTDGRLDRKQLRALIFADPSARAHLEAILHPRIHAAAIEQLKHVRGDYAILVIPLLVESKQRYPYDRILLVDCPVELQRARLRARDQLSGEQIDAILAVQASREQRLARADDVITNQHDLATLHAQVLEQHDKYRQMAATPLPRS